MEFFLTEKILKKYQKMGNLCTGKSENEKLNDARKLLRLEREREELEYRKLIYPFMTITAECGYRQSFTDIITSETNYIEHSLEFLSWEKKYRNDTEFKKNSEGKFLYFEDYKFIGMFDTEEDIYKIWNLKEPIFIFPIPYKHKSMYEFKSNCNFSRKPLRFFK